MADEEKLSRMARLLGQEEDDIPLRDLPRPVVMPPSLPPEPSSETGQGANRGVSIGELRAEAAAKDFLNRLAQMLGEQRTVLSGNINLVGLHGIRATLGDDWPRHAERAQLVAQACIRQALALDDIFLRYDELRFLIVFAKLSREQAQAKCLEIGAEIGRRLLGENFGAEAARVETGVFESDGSLIFSSLTRESLMERLTGVFAANAASTGAPAAAPHGQHATPDFSAEFDEADKAGQAEAPPMPDFSFAQIDKTKALASIRILYRAMWDHRRQAITTYFATPAAANVFGRIVQDDDLRREYAEVLPPLEFDIFISRCVLRDMAELIGQGKRVLLCWPVDYEILAARNSRLTFLELCRDIPPSVRQLLMFEFCGLPEGAPQSRVLDIVSALKPYCRAVYLRVKPGFRNIAMLAQSGVAGVGFALSPFNNAEGGLASTKVMGDFARDCARNNLRSYVHGLTQRSQVQAALSAGIDYIDGPAVDRPTDLPGPMRRFNLDEIYGRSAG